MSGRVTDGLLHNKALGAISTTREKMIKNQEEAVTGKRVNKPSDDPVSAMRVVGLNAQSERDEQVSMNLEMASSILNLTDNSLGELTDVLTRAKELAIQMSSSSNQTEDSRQAVANEVDQLLMRAVQIGNTRIGDRYIFGGYQTERPPFDIEGNYFGDSGVVDLEIDRGQKLSINIPGVTPFYGLNEIPDSGQIRRYSPEQDGIPTISHDLRSPASVLAENQGIDPERDPDAYKQLEKESGVNVFFALRNFSQGLKDGSVPMINQSLDHIDDAYKQVLTSRSLVGARQNVLNAGQSSLETAKVTNAEMLSKTQDADTLKTLSDLAKNEHGLNASLEVSKRLLTPSLLDFLK